MASSIFYSQNLAADQYVNWGITSGTNGYGIRDNAGTIEFKNSAGSWAPIAASASSAGGWTKTGAVVALTTGTDKIGSNLIPATDATYTLGSTTGPFQWKSLFLANGDDTGSDGVLFPNASLYSFNSDEFEIDAGDGYIYFDGSETITMSGLTSAGYTVVQNDDNTIVNLANIVRDIDTVGQANQFYASLFISATGNGHTPQTGYNGVVGIQGVIHDRAGVGTTETKGNLYGAIFDLYPLAARGSNAPYDDAAGVIVANRGTGAVKMTDAFYVARGLTATGSQWFSGISIDADVDHAFRASGSMMTGLDFVTVQAATFSGPAVYLPNASTITWRNAAGLGDVNALSVDTSDHLVLGASASKFTGYFEGAEMSAPSAGAANTGRLFFQDNGGGKTQLMVIFNTGAAQQIAIQP